MKKHYTYIFVNKYWESGCSNEMAIPPCSWWKEWIFRHILIAKADFLMDKTASQFSEEKKKRKFQEGLVSDFVDWHKFFFFAKYEKKPDLACKVVLAQGRYPVFTAYVFMEGMPNVCPFERFMSYVQECLDTAYTVSKPGEHDILKFEIPEVFYE